MLPLWSPSPVPVGAVGYLSKPSGSFIQLFNSLAPKGTPAPAGMPSLSGYGRVSEGNQRHDTRNVAKRGLDVITGRLASKSKGDDRSLYVTFSVLLRCIAHIELLVGKTLAGRSPGR